MTVFHARVAGLRIDLVIDGEAPEGLRRWSPYACAAGPAEIVLSLMPARPRSLRRLTGRVVVDGGLWRAGGAEQLGWLDPVSGRGQAIADPSLVVADALARAALARSVGARGGALFHAVAVEVDGQAHLVPGHSGAGKSTLARLAGHVLTDELAAVFPGTGGEPTQVFGTPWWHSDGGNAPLAAVYRLAWDEPAVTPLHGPGLLRHLTQGLVLPFDAPEERARAFAVCGALARTTRFARLAFRHGTDVDALLRGQAAWRAA
jgi:hypothetical protein